MMSLLSRPKARLALLLVFVVIVVIGIFVLVGRSGDDIDKIPFEGTSDEFTSQVVMFDNPASRDLFQKVESAARFGAIRSDLFFFAQKNYPQYQEKNKIIGFKITSQIIKNGDTVTFSGRYGALNNKIFLSVTLLPNTRIKTSIKDEKKNIQTDSQLPSNSRRNQVISELPVSTKDYDIDYDKTTDSFIINIFQGGPEKLNLALAYLADKLGIKDMGQEKYSFRRTSTGGMFSPVPIVDNQAGDFYE